MNDESTIIAATAAATHEVSCIPYMKSLIKAEFVDITSTQWQM
jgi:hypothetical protein